MKILSEKKSICTTMKVLYDESESYYQDIEQKKKDGWKVVTKPNWYDGRHDYVIKRSSNGTVLTYIRYDQIG